MCAAENILEKHSFDIEGGNFSNAGTVSTKIKSILKQKNLPDDVVRRSAIVCYEAEINIVSYAKKGVISLTIRPNSVQIEADDEGPGIPNIELAMQQGYSTANQQIREMGFGAGMGLHNIKTYSDIFDISSEVDKGTFLKMTIHTQPAKD
ncbi:MAG TPA: ATP-binding protein [Smithellaceae bacterium]|nr:ATP-binding protein [Smithellaceae bacterium]HRS88609.1 ATP-binding protein [Smithellaceae bacterium]HRV25889.1 ATP-binding protein [Smithellaceae bacterium]